MRPYIYKIFHKLWNAAVGTPGYVGEEWLVLEAELETVDRLQRERDALRMELLELDDAREGV